MLQTTDTTCQNHPLNPLKKEQAMQALVRISESSTRSRTSLRTEVSQQIDTPLPVTSLTTSAFGDDRPSVTDTRLELLCGESSLVASR